MTHPSLSDLLDRSNPLPENPSLAQVEEWLEELADQAKEAPPGPKAVIREAAVNRLDRVEAVNASAKLVDAYLAYTSSNRASASHQGSLVCSEDPEPWPEAVEGAVLLEELVGTFTTYLALPDGAAVALSLWTLHAHAQDASLVSPVLAITSPEKRCGKTTLLELLAGLVPRPLPASNVTAATVFRAVERWQPTLLVDEADTFLQEGSQLRGVLNSGHRRSMAYVARTVGDDHEARAFQTWAPKAIALIGELPDTLADRSVEVRMRRKAPDEKVKRLRLDRTEELDSVCRKAWTWARAYERELAGADPDLPDGLHDRQQDNWRPLVAIADAAGGEWPERAREAAEVLSSDGQDDRSLGTRLLADIRSILQKHLSDRIRSKELVSKLCKLEEAPWSEYKGKGLTAVSLANFLRSFGVSSKQLRFASGSYKGYEASAFEDAFRRYLPSRSKDHPAEAKQSKQSRSERGSDSFPTRNSGSDVSPSESPERPDPTDDVSGVSPSQGKRDKGSERPSGEREARPGTRYCPICTIRFAWTGQGDSPRPIGPAADICGACKAHASHVAESWIRA